MKKIVTIVCLWLAFSNLAAYAQTNSLVWDKAAGRVDADLHGEPLMPLLEDIAHQTGWHIFVEPGSTRNASTKFMDLPTDDALRMLLGNLNFAFVPQANGPDFLYVFMTSRESATQSVRVEKPVVKKQGHVPNELMVKLKPGANIDALAKAFGAKVVARNDKLGIYLLDFSDAASSDAALAALKGSSDVAAVDYNYIYDAPPSPQAVANAPVGPVSLKLNPPGSTGKLTVGLIDTPVQPLDSSLNDFLLKQISVTGDTYDSGTGPTHGTAMAEAILRAISQASGGSTSAQILPVNVYSSGESTTTWDVALGIQAAVDNGANVLNLSLGGTGDSSVLDSVVQQAIAAGIPIFAAAGNQPVNTPTYPAAYNGVFAVTATQNGQVAPYANYGNFVTLAFPGSTVVYLGGTAYMVQGTSVSTATATGVAVGNKSKLDWNWSQIGTAMQKQFTVPQK
ncbi:MAG TPA: S8 family serine peptidase [Verrucomicrobiae bacterium]|nr:S8 family serine peptidase [Verrucomicrobiae bacterium]